MNKNEQAKLRAAKRDRKMAADFFGGMTQRELAKKYGLTPKHVASRLALRLKGVTISPEERRKRFLRAIQNGAKVGRPQVWPDCPAHLRAEYMRLRKTYEIPAPEARRMLEEDARR